MMQRTTVAKRNFRRQGIKATVHDRRTSDLVRGAEVASIEIDDPLALEPGDKLTVMRSTRDDPLAKLHSRHQIDDAQYAGGRAFQKDWERAERGPRAVDPTKEAVDGGQLAEPITEGQRKAVVRLNRCEWELGADGSAIAHAFLIQRLTVSDMGRQRGLTGERWDRYFGMRLRECLDRLALVYGFATKAVRDRREGLDWSSKSPVDRQSRK